MGRQGRCMRAVRLEALQVTLQGVHSFRTVRHLRYMYELLGEWHVCGCKAQRGQQHSHRLGSPRLRFGSSRLRPSSSRLRLEQITEAARSIVQPKGIRLLAVPAQAMRHHCVGRRE